MIPSWSASTSPWMTTMEKRKQSYQICRLQEGGQEDKYIRWPNHEPNIINRLFQSADSNGDKFKILHFGLKAQLKRYRIGVSLLSRYEKASQAHDDSIHSREVKRIRLPAAITVIFRYSNANIISSRTKWDFCPVQQRSDSTWNMSTILNIMF